MSANSALNRRPFLGRGPALAAVPAVASLAAEGLTGRASAGTLPYYAPIHHARLTCPSLTIWAASLPESHPRGIAQTGIARAARP
jgi:hypothetical protein